MKVVWNDNKINYSNEYDFFVKKLTESTHMQESKENLFVFTDYYDVYVCMQEGYTILKWEICKWSLIKFLPVDENIPRRDNML